MDNLLDLDYFDNENVSKTPTIWDIENAEKNQLISFIENSIMEKVKKIIDEKDKEINTLKKQIKDIQKMNETINNNSNNITKINTNISKAFGFSFEYYDKIVTIDDIKNPDRKERLLLDKKYVNLEHMGRQRQRYREVKNYFVIQDDIDIEIKDEYNILLVGFRDGTRLITKFDYLSNKYLTEYGGNVINIEQMLCGHIDPNYDQEFRTKMNNVKNYIMQNIDGSFVIRYLPISIKKTTNRQEALQIKSDLEAIGGFIQII